MLKHDTKKFILSRIRDNRVFSAILVCECIFLIILAANSCGAPFSVTIPADHLTSTQADRLSYSGTGISVDSTGSGDTVLILSSSRYRVPSGAYSVKVSYTARGSETTAGNSDTGYISASSEKYTSRVHCGSIPLRFDRTMQSQQLWIPYGCAVSDLVFNVYYNHLGTLSLTSVSLTEYTSWRSMRFLGFLLIFASADLVFLLLYLPDPPVRHRRTLISLAAVILLSSFPYMCDFLYDGHDLWFHLERITSLAAELSAGHFPARIESTMLNGYGYPFSLFYGDIFLYLPAALCNLHVPVQLCYQIYVILVNAATCVFSYLTFREITGDNETLGITGSLLYTFSAYRMLNLLVRGAVGEYTAMAFIPLIFLGIHRIYFTDSGNSIRASSFMPLVIGFSGIIESHILTAIIAVPFIVLFIIFFARRSADPRRITAWCWTVILVICLNLWFLLPFIESLHMKIIGNDPEKINQIQHYGTYLIQLFSLSALNVTGHSDVGTKGEMPLSVGLALTAGLLVYVYALTNRRKWKLDSEKDYRLSLYYLTAAAGALYLSSVWFPWDSLRSLDYNTARFICSIQFPWRYLSAASFFLTGLTLFGLKYVRTGLGRIHYRRAVILIAVSSLLYTGLFYGSYLYQDDECTCYSALDAGTGDIMGQEYLLRDTNYDLMDDSGMILNSTGISASCISRSHGSYVFSCSNNSSHASSLDLPLLSYDNYHAYVKGTPAELTVGTGANNRLRVTVPASFNDMVEVRYVEPASWRWSELISVVTLILLIVHSLFTFYRKKVNR